MKQLLEQLIERLMEPRKLQKLGKELLGIQLPDELNNIINVIVEDNERIEYEDLKWNIDENLHKMNKDDIIFWRFLNDIISLKIYNKAMNLHRESMNKLLGEK